MNPMKILLVDDEQEFVAALAERLELRGYQVEAVNSGEEALQAVEAAPPKAVVLDVKMPGLSGLEVLKSIKAQFPSMPVLLLTGYGSTEDGMKGMRFGAYDYLMKPLNIEDLIKKIHEAVGAAEEKPPH